VNKLKKIFFSKTCKIFISILSIFFIFYFFIFLFFLGGWAQLSPCGGWAGPSQPGLATGPSQWPSWAKEEEARVK
jgi:hypothetical protein